EGSCAGRAWKRAGQKKGWWVSTNRKFKKERPMPAVFDQKYVKRLSGTHVKKGKTKMALAEQLREETGGLKKKNRLSRMVMVWCASTEMFIKPHPVHKTLEAFEKAMRENHRAIAP